MTKRKTVKEVEANILEVAQELLNGNQTNLETLQKVISNGASTMKVYDPFDLLKNDGIETSVVEEAKVKKVGIGSTIITLILDNPTMTNQEILAKVKEQFEAAQTSYACVAWYKSKLRKEGKIGARVLKQKEQPQKVAK